MDSPVSQASMIQRLDQRRDGPPDRYFDEFLKVTASMTDAAAAQVWGLNDTGRLVKIGDQNPAVFQSLDHADVIQEHRDLISRTLFEGTRQTNQVTLSDTPAATPQWLTMMPLHLAEETVGVVEMVLPYQLEQPQIQVLDELLAHASGFLAKSAMTNPGDGQSRTAPGNSVRDAVVGSSPKPGTVSPAPIEDFIWSLHQPEDWKSTASAVVNETRRLLGCDRVSLAVRRGSSCEIVSVSGQDTVAKNSNTLRALQRIADQVLRSGQGVAFEIGDTSLGNQPNEFVVDYLQETEALGLQAIPLMPHRKPDFDAEESNNVQQPFAVLFIEQFSDNAEFIKSSANDIPRLIPHIAQATFHSWQQQRIFLRPTRQAIGRLLEQSKVGSTKAALMGGAFLLCLAVMYFGKSAYRVPAVGKLMPAEQFRAYAPFNGEVQQVWVTSGQFVEHNQPLLSLYDEGMSTRLLTLENDLARKQKTLAANKAQLDQSQAAMPASDRIGLNAKIAQTESEISGLEYQIDSVQRLLLKSDLRAEIPGTVATFRPDDLLSGRPVNRGDLLVEVMNEDGPWILELELPAKRYGHLMQTSLTNPQDRPVSFILATDPERTYEAKIQNVSTRASDDGQGESVFLLRASVSGDERLPHTIGADVTAKIDCGRERLGYVLFGDIIDWIQIRLW